MLLSPYLPPLARHTVYKMDFGVVVDFWFCVVAFGLIRIAMWWGQRKRSRQQ